MSLNLPAMTSRDRFDPDPRATMWLSPAGGAAYGGDWCDATVHADGLIALTIGDVSGHGAAAAEGMRAVRTSILHALRFMRDPSDVLAVANGFVLDRLDERLVTAIVAFVDPVRGSFTYANAGHPPPLLVTQQDTRFLCSSPADIPLGIFKQRQTRTHELALPPESMLLFYTDGITEHGRDVLSGEIELAEMARFVYDEQHDDAAAMIAEGVLRMGRGHDDAATMVLRLADSRTPRR